MTARTAFGVTIFLGALWTMYGLVDVTSWVNFAVGALVTCVGVIGRGFTEFHQ